VNLESPCDVMLCNRNDATEIAKQRILSIDLKTKYKKYVLNQLRNKIKNSSIFIKHLLQIKRIAIFREHNLTLISYEML
jgi:hypothetical protein